MSMGVFDDVFDSVFEYDYDSFSGCVSGGATNAALPARAVTRRLDHGSEVYL